jgi:hypothetical protein
MNCDAVDSSDADGAQGGEETGGSVERKKASGFVLRRCPIARSACFRTATGQLDSSFVGGNLYERMLATFMC